MIDFEREASQFLKKISEATVFPPCCSSRIRAYDFQRVIRPSLALLRCPVVGLSFMVDRADSYGEQVRTSKAGDRATGESRGTFRTRLHPNSATSEGKAGAIATCSHVLPPDAQCHWSISQAQNRQRCEKGLKRLRRCFFLTIPPTLHERE